MSTPSASTSGRALGKSEHDQRATKPIAAIMPFSARTWLAASTLVATSPGVPVPDRATPITPGISKLKPSTTREAYRTTMWTTLMMSARSNGQWRYLLRAPLIAAGREGAICHAPCQSPVQGLRSKEDHHQQCD